MITARARIRITRVAPEGELIEQVVPSIANLTGAVTKRMQRLVPKLSWRLHDSITDEGAKVVGSKAVGRVAFGGKVVRGQLVTWHMLVERGTSRMRAQPYARPALLQSTSADLKGMRS